MQFHYQGQLIEGIVISIGWARTAFRTFGREIVAIPNSVFSRTPIKNVTKKKNEWRIDKVVCMRLTDIRKVPQIVADMQHVVNTDPRTIKTGLHRRVYWTDVDKDVVRLLIQFYVEAPNRDVFLQIQQDFMMMFTEIVYGHGAQFSESKLNVRWQGDAPHYDPAPPAFYPAEQSITSSDLHAAGPAQQPARGPGAFEWYRAAKPVYVSDMCEKRLAQLRKAEQAAARQVAATPSPSPPSTPAERNGGTAAAAFHHVPVPAV